MPGQPHCPCYYLAVYEATEMSEGMRLQRKTTPPTTDSTQGTFAPPNNLNAAFTATSSAPEATSETQSKVPSSVFRGHDFRRVAVFEGMSEPQVEDELAQQSADGAVKQEHQSQALAKIQAKSIQPARGFDFRQIPIFSPEQGHSSDRPSPLVQRQAIAEEMTNKATPYLIQPKLTIGAPNDPYEQEADRMADRVMSMPNTLTQQPIQRNAALEDELQTKPLATSITPLVQREILSEAEVQAKYEAYEQGGQVQRSPNGTVQAQPDLEGRLNVSKTGGSPLSNEVRSFMEPRFGADFSEVRVHTDGEAVHMNQELGAQAFTHGRDIYYGRGKSPGINDLTAHELTHTMQQGPVQLVQLQREPDQFNALIQNGDWHGAAWTLAQRDPQEITAQISSMSSMKRIYLVEGARHGEGRWNIDAIISAVYNVSHREAIIGSVRFFVWKHRWGEVGTYLCGLNDEDMRQVAIDLKLTLRDMTTIADEQPSKPQAERISVVLLGNPKVVLQAPKDLIGNDGDKKAELWLLGDPLVGQYAKKKFDAGIVVRGHLHIIPSNQWADTYVKHNLGRRDPDTGEIISIKNADELRAKAVVVGGFCEDHKEIYIRQGDESPGTVLHEAVHLIAEDSFKENYGSAVNEGATEYFARLVARHAGLHPNRSYLTQHDGVAALAHLVGDETLARAFFTGKVLAMQQIVEDTKGTPIFRQWVDAMRDDNQRKNAPNILNSAPNISK